MKNTSKTMYRFGNLLQIIYLAIAALVALIALIIIIVGLITGNEPLTSSGVSSLVSMIISKIDFLSLLKSLEISIIIINWILIEGHF